MNNCLHTAESECRFLKILKKINVLNYDNGKNFTKTDRLDAIGTLLWSSQYRRINAQGLFHLYSKVPISDLNEKVTVISSHIDCHNNISQNFTNTEDREYLRGTFDNAITNAAVIYLMLTGGLPANTVIAFTGDEERNSVGALSVVDCFQKIGIQFKVIVLDVTDMGWKEAADFTVENNFWNEQLGNKVISTVSKSNYNWRFVPSDPGNIPCYIPENHVIRQEAESDESWDYDEKGIECFSLCIPTKGEMHSNKGIFVRRQSLFPYMEILSQLCSVL